MLRKWNELPEFMKNKKVLPYYQILQKKSTSLFLKRIFDIVASVVMLVILFPIMSLLSIAIVLDSEGGVFFCQERVTQYGRKFKIHKFRTMVANAEKLGSQVTVNNDMRVTRVGKIIRKYRLDELPQLIDVLKGDMSFVGTRPEVPKYVKKYSPEMMATLLLPAGITSEASICYKDEDKLLKSADDADEVYVRKILPGKMKYNLKAIKNFSFFNEISTMFRTIIEVLM